RTRLRPPTPTLSPYTTLFRSRKCSTQPSCNTTGQGRLRLDLGPLAVDPYDAHALARLALVRAVALDGNVNAPEHDDARGAVVRQDRKSTRLNSSHVKISYAVF